MPVAFCLLSEEVPLKPCWMIVRNKKKTLRMEWMCARVVLSGKFLFGGTCSSKILIKVCSLVAGARV